MRLLNPCSFVRTRDDIPLTIPGGPGKKESIGAWRARLQSELAEQKGAEQEPAKQGRTEERARLERGGTDAVPVGHSSSLSGGEGSENLFRVQVASFADLDRLTRENRETLGEVKCLLGQTAAAGTVPSGMDLTDKLGNLDSLIAMAKTLGEMTVSGHWRLLSVGSNYGWGG